MSTTMTAPAPSIASPATYLPARISLLAAEKEHTRAHDALIAQRRALPLVEITKPYCFTTMSSSIDGSSTTLSLADLFSHRKQLIIQHIMFSPEDTSACPNCSSFADQVVALEHLWARQTTFVAVSRAPIAKIDAYKKRMGWTFPWVSSYEDPEGFNYDFHVTLDPAVANVQYNFRGEKELLEKGMKDFVRGEQPGLSCFVLGDGGHGEGMVGGQVGKVYHSYSTYARGMEGLDLWGLLDLTYLGRNAGGQGVEWKRRDEYTDEDLRIVKKET